MLVSSRGDYVFIFDLLLRALQQHILTRRREEEVRLNQESDRSLEELRQCVQRQREEQQDKLRSDNNRIICVAKK